MTKKIKTPTSELYHKYCVLPARKTKNQSIKNNKPFEAGFAAIIEKDCKKAEEYYKWKQT